MKKDLFKHLIGYNFSNEEEKMKETKPLRYVAAGNGLFEVRSNRVMQVSSKVSSIENIPEIEEEVELKIPKIPMSIFNIIVSFMKKIYIKDKTESTIMVFYNAEEDKFIPFVPKQKNGSASSNYDRDDDPEYAKINKDNILVMVAHSHPWPSKSGPSPSGTDNNDEKEAILYMIIGNVEGLPTVTLSTCPGKKRIMLKFSEVYENPLITENMNEITSGLIQKYIPEEEIVSLFCSTEEEIPEAWINRCNKTIDMQKDKWDYSNKNWKTRNKDYGYPYSSYMDYESYADYAGYGKSYYGEWTNKREVQTIVSEDKETVNKILTSEDFEDIPLLMEDVIDAALDMTDIEIAQLILALKKEGHGSLIHKCLAPNKETKSTKKDKKKERIR